MFQLSFQPNHQSKHRKGSESHKVYLPPLYLLAALIHHFAYGDSAAESLVTVLASLFICAYHCSYHFVSCNEK